MDDTNEPPEMQTRSGGRKAPHLIDPSNILPTTLTTIITNDFTNTNNTETINTVTTANTLATGNTLINHDSLIITIPKISANDTLRDYLQGIIYSYNQRYRNF